MAMALLCRRHLSVFGLAYGDGTAESVLQRSEDTLSISSFVLAPKVKDARQKKAFETKREHLLRSWRVFAFPSACSLEAARR
jgi:hypothetical protein